MDLRPPSGALLPRPPGSGLDPSPATKPCLASTVNYPFLVGGSLRAAMEVPSPSSASFYGEDEAPLPRVARARNPLPRAPVPAVR